MLDGIVHLSVNHLLVDGSFGMVALCSASFDGQSHHAVAQQRYLVAGVVVDAHGHLVLGRFLILGRCLLRVVVACRQDS